LWQNTAQKNSKKINPQKPPTQTRPVEEETKRQFDTMVDALRAGKDEGSAKAREAAPSLKSCVAEAFHDLAYGIAYGAFFTGSFANEIVPKTVKSGLAKGAEAGKAAARKAREKASEAFSPSAEEDAVESTEERSTIPQTI
jgi:hypothetical protein